MAKHPPDRARGILTAYFSHLLVPLFIALDEVKFFLFEHVELHRPLIDKIVLSCCVAWLAVSLGAFFLSKDQTLFSRRIEGPLISFYATLFVLVVFEGFVRIALRPAPPALWPPGTQWVFQPASWGVPVPGTTRFSVNELGLRGPALPRQGHPYKIVAVGGSTTACWFLDDSKEWPHLVMEGLNSRQKKLPVWVANAGVPGHNSVHHLAVLKTLPIFKQVDMVVILTGVNDLSASLAFEGAPSQTQLERSAEVFREYMLRGAESERYLHPIYKRLRLYQLAQQAKDSLLARFEHAGTGASETERELWQRRRAEGKIVSLPDLHVGLSEYRERVQRLAQQCRVLDVRCLFLTQPVLWRSGLTPAEERSLWFGYVGRWETRKRFVAASDLELAMNAYNLTLLGVCEQDGLECFDLAAAIPKNGSVFYDDVHYTEAGARLIADRLLEYLLSTPPFSEQSASDIQQQP